ncbi:hypothetical protein Tco_0299982, partial [Tanacetum coccineum]
YLLYGSAGGRVITAAGGHNIVLQKKVKSADFHGKSHHNKFTLLGQRRSLAMCPLDALGSGRCDAYGLVTSS